MADKLYDIDLKKRIFYGENENLTKIFLYHVAQRILIIAPG